MLHGLATSFKTCVDQLHSFATPQQRHSFTEESTALTLVSYQDTEALGGLTTNPDASLPSSLTEGFQLKRELQVIRNSAIDASLWKPAETIITESSLATTVQGRESLLKLATYSERGGRAVGRIASPPGIVVSITYHSVYPPSFCSFIHNLWLIAVALNALDAAQRVLVEWTTVRPNWEREHVQLYRSRITKLVQELNIASKPTTLRMLRAIALVEDFRDERNRRFGIVFSIPPRMSPLRQPIALQKILPVDSNSSSPFGEPLLSHRFALAHSLAVAVHELHRSGWLHKELRSSNIVFFFGGQSSSFSAAATAALPDLSNPYITGFGLARPDEESAGSLPATSLAICSTEDLFRHPSLRLAQQGKPGKNRQEGEKGEEAALPRFQRRFDIYSLGLILLEIGLWERISSLGRPADKVVPLKFTAQLATLCSAHVGHRMGATYRDVVLRCIQGADTDAADGDEGDDGGEEMMAFYFGVVKELEKCQCGRRV